jgi:hypothetical protein
VVTIDETDIQSYYDMTIGQDLQQAMGIDILFSSKQLRLDKIEILM